MDEGQQLGLEGVDVVEVGGEGGDVLAEFVDAVDGVEQCAQGGADGDVEAVVFPVEVASDGAPVVVEVGELVAQLVGGGLHVSGVGEHVVVGVGEFSGQGFLALGEFDHGLELVGHAVHVGDAVFEVADVFEGDGVLHVELEGDGAVFDR
ncbi:hypothetical protein MYBA111488_24755 [Mycobacterium basiliense]